MSPWEFEEAKASHRIGVDDIREMLILESCSTMFGTDMDLYLHREWKMDRKDRQRKIIALSRKFQSEKDPERQAEIGRQIDELNGAG